MCVRVHIRMYLQSALCDEFCLLSYSIILFIQPLLGILQLCLCSLQTRAQMNCEPTPNVWCVHLCTCTAYIHTYTYTYLRTYVRICLNVVCMYVHTWVRTYLECFVHRPQVSQLLLQFDTHLCTWEHNGDKQRSSGKFRDTTATQIKDPYLTRPP